jgi:hypothetical protein
MNFFTKIETPPVQVIELSDLDRIRKYKKELVDSLVYEPPPDLTERKKIAQEAANVDRWLADGFKEFMNDNNRKLAL